MSSPASRNASVACRVLVIQNPRAGARSGQLLVRRLEALLQAAGLVSETVSHVEHYADKVAAYRELAEPFVVVAAGGDGTVSLVVNHTPPETPVAILPLGTENLLAKQLGLTADPALLCRTICAGRQLQIDAGEADGRLFLLMAGCGFDAEVVRRLHRDRRGHIHRLSYAKPIIDSIRSYQYPELRVYCEPPHSDVSAQVGTPCDRTPVLSARWAFVVNLPRYAAGLRIAPRASGNDGLLDVCTFKEGSLWSGLRYLGGIACGQHVGWSDFRSLRTRHLRIEADEPVPYQLDGDPGGTLPVTIRVSPARATLLIPPHSQPAAAASE